MYIFSLLFIVGFWESGALPRISLSSLLNRSIRSSAASTQRSSRHQPILTAQDYDDVSDTDYPIDNDGRGFKSAEFVMGRDKELFHASIDLGWMYNTLINKKTWQDVGSRIWQRLCRISVDYNKKVLYREGLLRLAAQLKVLNPQCSLRLVL